MDKINICVCTYKRKELLAKCLHSIYNMALPSDTEITLTVIDNDEQQSAKQVIDDFSTASSLPTYYVNERKHGIPHARNRALTESYALQADYLVFIDDDDCTNING